MYSSSLIEETVVRLLRDAECRLPPDVHAALRHALDIETEEMPRSQLLVILSNVDKASERSVPICQDTGLPVFFVHGRCDERIVEAIRKGVARATEEIPLRPNTVDPVSRENLGSNLGAGMPPMHLDPVDQDHLDIAVLPKGAGSENWSALRMLNPSEGMEGVRRFIIECVVKAGSRPCPPVIVGVGIGGTADMACVLAKKALLRKLSSHSDDAILADLESQLLLQINSLGLGPMGLGGSTTCLGVLVEKSHCHTASLPVAVSLNCWAARKAFARIYPDGRVRFSQEGFD
ncbi:MAG TPA: fumarate hydratase [Methanomassiliicoccales archaeon]|nr:fumarate hydratase [Methanomassiliicoccales archaeon]HPR98633.1 fumarate hydratase [Methanomassiliicoccales archaeon]